MGQINIFFFVLHFFLEIEFFDLFYLYGFCIYNLFKFRITNLNQKFSKQTAQKHHKIMAKVKYPVCPLLLCTAIPQVAFLLNPWGPSKDSSYSYISLLRHSIVCTFMKFCFLSYTVVLCTCSIHGEKQHILPSIINHKFTFLEHLFSMVNGRPWIWNVQK